MNSRSLKLLALLAMLVAMEPLRAAWAAHHVHQICESGRGHRHAAPHTGHAHAHAHVHHEGCEAEGVSEDHNCFLDHLPDVPEIEWVPPRVSLTGATATPIALPAATLPSSPELEPARRARPPPGSAAARSSQRALRTTILRL